MAITPDRKFEKYYKMQVKKINLLIKRLDNLHDYDKFIKLSPQKQRDTINDARLVINSIANISSGIYKNKDMEGIFQNEYDKTKKALDRMGITTPNLKTKSTDEIRAVKSQLIKSISDGSETMKAFSDTRFEMTREFDNAFEANNPTQFKPRVTLLQVSDENKFIDSNGKKLLSKDFRNTQREATNILRDSIEKGKSVQKTLPQLIKAMDKHFPNGKVPIYSVSPKGKPYFRNIDIADYANTWYKDSQSFSHTEGTLSSMTLAGADLVDIVGGITDNPICDPFVAEKTFSLSGKSDKYPRLDSYPPFHPNCSKRIVASSENINQEPIDFTEKEKNQIEEIQKQPSTELPKKEQEKQVRKPSERAKEQYSNTTQIGLERGGEDKIFDFPTYSEREIFKINDQKIKEISDKILKIDNNINIEKIKPFNIRNIKFDDVKNMQEFKAIKSYADEIQTLVNSEIHTELDKYKLFDKNFKPKININLTLPGNDEYSLQMLKDIINEQNNIINEKFKITGKLQSLTKDDYDKIRSDINKKILANIDKSIKDSAVAINNFNYVYKNIFTEAERNIINSGLLVYNTKLSLGLAYGSYNSETKLINDGANITTLIHESGHCIADTKLNNNSSVNFNSKFIRAIENDLPTRYASKNEAEMWSEIFTFYKLDPNHLKTYYPDIYNYVEKVEKSGYTKYDWTLEEVRGNK